MEPKSGACMSGALHYCVGLYAFMHVGMHLGKGGVMAQQCEPVHTRATYMEKTAP
jgi:hypothetical protein